MSNIKSFILKNIHYLNYAKIEIEFFYMKILKAL